jgi:hypothetical protein
MPLRKLRDLEPGFRAFPAPCRHPDHSPPTHIALSPGVYEHECAGCGIKTVFTVEKPTWQAREPGQPLEWAATWREDASDDD